MSITDLALLLAFIPMSVMAVALWAIAHHVGDGFVFTSEGVSRMGPSVGDSIGSFEFKTVSGERSSIRQVTSSNQATFLLFAYRDSSLMAETIQALAQFKSNLKSAMPFVIFHSGSTRELEKFVRVSAGVDELDVSFIRLPELSDGTLFLTTQLMIRVFPYGVIVDRNSRVLAKGLVNSVPHFCLLSMMGKSGLLTAQVDSIMTTCQSLLTADLYRQLLRLKAQD